METKTKKIIDEIVYDWIVKETTPTLERMRDNGYTQEQYAKYKEDTTNRCFSLRRWINDGGTVETFTG